MWVCFDLIWYALHLKQPALFISQMLAATSGVAAEELYSVVVSPQSTNEEKLQLIMNLKSHVKRDFVDISQVPKYMEALSIAIDISDVDILSNAFSMLCHLIKRVSIQDATSKVLKEQSFLVLPIIINKLGDVKSNSRSSAKKALESYWLSASAKVEQGLLEIGFSHRNPKVVSESISWLNHIIVNINPHFKLDAFVPTLVETLATHKSTEEIVELTKDLFKSYYNMKHNRLHKFELQKELDAHKIPTAIKASIINVIDMPSSQLSVQKRLLLHLPTYASPTLSSSNFDPKSDSLPAKSHHFAPRDHPTFPPRDHSIRSDHIPSYASSTISAASKAGSPHADHRKTRVRSSPSLRRPVQREETRSTSDAKPKPPVRAQSPVVATNSISDIDGDNDINKIIFKIPNYPLDTSILPIDCRSPDELYRRIEDLQPVFSSKETEFNWSAREKSIITLRSILRGNAADDFLDDLISNVRGISDGICKAITSLRTTLSAHGCQLIKEMAVILKSAFDPLADLFLPTLIKLCSATKNIASTNANMAICTMFLNISFSSRWFSKILLASSEKNTSPRSFSGLWLQIALIRFFDAPSFLSPHGSNGTTGVDVSKRIISKLLTDPNPTVRQVAKETYWCFWSKFKTEAESILANFDSNTVKGIERSRPKEYGNMASLHNKKSRPSIRDVIIAKNKEMKSRQRDDQRQASRESSVAQKPTSRDLSLAHRPATKNPSVMRRPMSRAPSRSSTDNLDQGGIHSIIEQRNSKIGTRVNSPSIVPVLPTDITSKEVEIQAYQHPIGEESPLKNDSFDKQSDPILKFLSSSKIELIEEGINLLRYAIIGNEDLSTEINQLLTSISIENPKLLEPLFLQGDNLFRKSALFFKADDLLRICSIIVPMNEKIVSIITSSYSAEEVFDSTIKIISSINNLNNIIDGRLMMQVIKFKNIMVSSIIDFLLLCTDKIPMTDSQFLELTSVFFDLVDLLRSTRAISSFTNLLQKLYAINSGLFTSELRMLNNGTREDIETIIGIDNSTEFTLNMNHQLGSAGDLTKVVPNECFNFKISPLKAPSDLTMLVPLRRGGPDSTIILKKNIGSLSGVGSRDMDIDEPRFNELAEIDIDAEPVFDKVVEDSIDIEDDVAADHIVEPDQFEEEAYRGRENITGQTERGIADGTDIETALDVQIQHKIHDYPMNELESAQKTETGTEGPYIVDTSFEKLTVHEKEQINANEDEVDIERSLNYALENSHPDDFNNIFKTETSPINNDLFAIFNQHESVELVDDFAQVQITEVQPSFNPKEKTTSPRVLNLNGDNSIQDLIDKVDPISKLANKNKPITIFQDGNAVSGSPQKLKDYCYSEFNWFNFQIAKGTSNNVQPLVEEVESGIKKFNSICKKLESASIEKPQILSLFHFLQGTQTLDFCTYFESTGKLLLEESLWAFFSTEKSLAPSLQLSGLLIIKQLLINRISINLEKLWSILLLISSNNLETLNELSLACREVYDEVHYGIYSSATLVQLCLTSLKAVNELTGKSCLFVIECLSKLLGMNFFHLLVDDSLIIQIDEVLETLIDHEDVEIRRFVILSYGKLLKASRITKNGDNSLISASEKNAFDSILQKLSLPQQKLVEYYSQD